MGKVRSSGVMLDQVKNMVRGLLFVWVNDLVIGCLSERLGDRLGKRLFEIFGERLGEMLGKRRSKRIG